MLTRCGRQLAKKFQISGRHGCDVRRVILSLLMEWTRQSLLAINIEASSCGQLGLECRPSNYVKGSTIYLWIGEGHINCKYPSGERRWAITLPYNERRMSAAALLRRIYLIH